jgi:preprotein translocase subunit SecD
LLSCAFPFLLGCANRHVSYELLYAPDTRSLAPGEAVDREAIALAVNDRLQHFGQAAVNEQGQIVVHVFDTVDDSRLQSIKRLASSMGVLEFRITAQQGRPEIQPIINQALALPPSQNRVEQFGESKAEWIEYAVDEFGGPDVFDQRIIKRTAGGKPQALVLIDSWNVDGSHLQSANIGVDEAGRPAIHIAFNDRGAQRFGQLTSENLPNPTTGAVRYLGIILDKRLLSAPSINSVISNRAVISGGAMSETDVEHVISVLNAGYLPCPIRLVAEQPVDMAMTVSGFRQLVPIALMFAIGAATLLVVAIIALAMKTR